jgi:hypothetical protein
VLGMESSDSSSNDSIDNWITVKNKKARKSLSIKTNDGHGHGTTRHSIGVTNADKRSGK